MGHACLRRPRRYSRQNPYYDDGDRRDDNILLAQAGSLNVRGPVDINYIYKIAVCDRGVPYFQPLEQAVLYQPDMELPGSDAPVAAQISQSSYFRQHTTESQGLLTVYHHRFRECPVAGWSGGLDDAIRLAPRRQGEASILRQNGYGGLAITCPLVAPLWPAGSCYVRPAEPPFTSP